MTPKIQRTARLFIASCLFLIGIPTLLFGLISAVDHGAERTIAHSRELKKTFEAASQFVFEFREEHRRLPSADELEGWARASTTLLNPDGLWLQVEPFPEKALERLGVPPKDSFMLIYWRGEWEEYYAPWNGRTTLIFDESRYYVSGSKAVDAAVLVVIALVLFSLGRRIWPDPLLRGTT